MKFIGLITILLHLNGFGQGTIDKSDGLFRKNRSLLLTGGYTYTSPLQHTIEFGAKTTSLSRYSSGDGQEMMKYFVYAYLIFGGEVVVHPELQLAPKVGIGYNILLFNGNLNLIMYNDRFRNFYPAIVPEAGFSWKGIVQLNYGYNLYFFNPNPLDNYRHRISFRISCFVLDDYLRPKKVK